MNNLFLTLHTSSYTTFAYAPLLAQINYQGLIVSEAYLDTIQPAHNWIEIYNPTSKDLILNSFRFSNVLTSNMLPREIIEDGGIKISSKKSVLLCVNKTYLDSLVNNESIIVQINDMSEINNGVYQQNI